MDPSIVLGQDPVVQDMSRSGHTNTDSLHCVEIQISFAFCNWFASENREYVDTHLPTKVSLYNTYVHHIYLLTTIMCMESCYDQVVRYSWYRSGIKKVIRYADVVSSVKYHTRPECRIGQIISHPVLAGDTVISYLSGTISFVVSVFC